MTAATGASSDSETNNASQIWTGNLAETILPYRIYFWLLLLICALPGLIYDPHERFPHGSGVLQLATTPAADTLPQQQCAYPDLCYQGYRPEDILEWYESIGNSGRLLYLELAIVDLVFVIPLYSLVLVLELHLASKCLSGHISAAVPCLPLVAVVLDWIETITHGYGVVVLLLREAATAGFGGTGLRLLTRLPLPPRYWLEVVSRATVAKFVVLMVVVAAVVSCWVARLVGKVVVLRAPPKSKPE